ncbi:DNA-binding protein [Hymenobacter jeollabukensis]|uniref:DNA-binding protein n=2 Tax=Hymenobacter jeollabukensis TaxID=2025313 RepID=A0A5R8WNX8_9BACT|nr:DNA-binding protein [Hymenobacter jeollabukensis]
MPAQPTAQSAPTKYTRTPTGFLMVLRQGDNVLQELEQLAVRENIPSASLTGLGFGHPTFGFWNAQTKTYAPKAFRDLELASLTGSIAWKDGKPALHLHGVGADKEFKPVGGHLLALEVGTGSVELTIVVHDQKLSRAEDPRNGATVLGVE